MILYLESVEARLEFRDVYPLAVDVVAVDVAAVDADPLVAEVSAHVPWTDSWQTLVVLQTERGLVTLCHAHLVGVDDVERREHLHTVVVPVGWFS